MDAFLDDVKLLPAGEGGLVVEFGTIISPVINLCVQTFMRMVSAAKVSGIIEVVPSYCSAVIYFDPFKITRASLTKQVEVILADLQLNRFENLAWRVVHIPVCYGGVLGPDLEYVAKYTGLMAEQVIKLHTRQPYLVYMLGFTPGFPYLGGLSDLLIVPRQEKPRSRVPIGSVGIGGNQTGFYSIESPGEWWLIGRTPLKAFDPARLEPFLLAPGDYVQFESIGLEQYFSIRQAVAQGVYQIKVSAEEQKNV
jgi:inhibitor of KinA